MITGSQETKLITLALTKSSSFENFGIFWSNENLKILLSTFLISFNATEETTIKEATKTAG